jgi:hypothetical protein
MEDPGTFRWPRAIPFASICSSRSITQSPSVSCELLAKPAVFVAGVAELENDERTWKFVPASPWSKGAYQIVVPTAIEDLAGNNVGKPFDVDLRRIHDQAPAESCRRKC